jgi:hypothetical protein
MLPSSLKGQNALGLYGILAANLALYFGAVQHDSLLRGDWADVARGARDILPAFVGVTLAGVLNAQLSAEAKARLVFLRWRNPLPGSEAFTKYARADPRVDLPALERSFGPLPTEPREQNALWYKMYKSVDTEPAVVQVHRAFLFARDYTCLAALALLVLGSGALIQIPSGATALGFIGILTTQLLLARRAACTHGRRFVGTVLALKVAR